MQYTLSIDQSTQSTKVALFDPGGAAVCHAMLSHRQIVNGQGWIEHDPEEIIENLYALVGQVVERSGVRAEEILAAGIANQRETAVAWSRITGRPLYHAIVWQCARGADICGEIENAGHGERIRALSGAPLSPYFTAAKYAWMLRNVPEVEAAGKRGELCLGTIDSWLLFGLTGEHKTDPANASRTQLFDLEAMDWSAELCGLFGVPHNALPAIQPTDSLFGYTDFAGVLPRPIPVHAMSGDSQASLYAHGCHGEGQVKTTYGTGSSVMMHTGGRPVASQNGLAPRLPGSWGAAPPNMCWRVTYTTLAPSSNGPSASACWKAPGRRARLPKAPTPRTAVIWCPPLPGWGRPIGSPAHVRPLWGWAAPPNAPRWCVPPRRALPTR